MDSPEPPVPPPPPPPPPAVAASGGDYPARLDLEPLDRIGRWRPLFQWVLAIPHFVVLSVISIVAVIVAFIAWFAIVFTGKLPEGLAGFLYMVNRYATRVGAYAAGLHDAYPPFDFATTAEDPGTYPARVQFQPEAEGRSRLTVALRFIWIIPAAIVTWLITLIAEICWFIGAIAVLFTGAWPGGLRDWVLKGVRANLRLSAYGYLLTDQYPPMSFD
jgi:hypothetical protein